MLLPWKSPRSRPRPVPSIFPFLFSSATLQSQQMFLHACLRASLFCFPGNQFSGQQDHPQVPTLCHLCRLQALRTERDLPFTKGEADTRGGKELAGSCSCSQRPSFCLQRMCSLAWTWSRETPLRKRLSEDGKGDKPLRAVKT